MYSVLLTLSDSVHIDEDRNSANKILMENFLEHIKQLHNKELLFTSAESQKFTRMLLNRPRENGPPLPFFMQGGTIIRFFNRSGSPSYEIDRCFALSRKFCSFEITH